MIPLVITNGSGVLPATHAAVWVIVQAGGG